MSTTLLAGATGLVGSAFSAGWVGPDELHLLVRREMPSPGPLQRVHVVDFSALRALPQAAEAYCCLGTTIKQAGSQAAFRAVDFDTVLTFATAASLAGVRRFAVVSALGANRRSANFYSRVKGEMEVALAGMASTAWWWCGLRCWPVTARRWANPRAAPSNGPWPWPGPLHRCCRGPFGRLPRPWWRAACSARWPTGGRGCASSSPLNCKSWAPVDRRVR